MWHLNLSQGIVAVKLWSSWKEHGLWRKIWVKSRFQVLWNLPRSCEQQSAWQDTSQRLSPVIVLSLLCRDTADPSYLYVIETGNKNGSSFTWRLVPRGLNIGSINSSLQDYSFPSEWNWSFLRHRKPWQGLLGPLLISRPWSRDGQPWMVHLRALLPVLHEGAAVTEELTWGTVASVLLLPGLSLHSHPHPHLLGSLPSDGQPHLWEAHPLIDWGFSVLFCWFVFNFCLESWNVLGKLLLSKFIPNPPTLRGPCISPHYCSGHWHLLVHQL